MPRLFREPSFPHCSPLHASICKGSSPFLHCCQSSPAMSSLGTTVPRLHTNSQGRPLQPCPSSPGSQGSSTFLTLPSASSPPAAASACARAKAAVLSKYRKSGYCQQTVGKAPCPAGTTQGEKKPKSQLLQCGNAQGCLAWHLQLSLSPVPCSCRLYLLSPPSHGSAHTHTLRARPLAAPCRATENAAL